MKKYIQAYLIENKKAIRKSPFEIIYEAIASFSSVCSTCLVPSGEAI